MENDEKKVDVDNAASEENSEENVVLYGLLSEVGQWRVKPSFLCKNLVKKLAKVIN